MNTFSTAFDDLDDPREELTFIVRAKEAEFTVVLTQPERMCFPADKTLN